MRYETINEATMAWVKEFNAFPIGMIERLYDADEFDWSEITPITKYDRVYVDSESSYGEVIDIIKDEYGNEIVKVELDGGKEIETEKEDLYSQYYGHFPMWGTMWQFNDNIDDWWMENHLEEMAECGFRIYESKEFGYFFGIDGAGYDFYEAHWIPLYKARGLHWHNTEMEG